MTEPTSQTERRAADAAILYVTSGTGNSLKVARWIAARLNDLDRGPARVVPIEAARPRDELDPDGRQFLGLLTPTHGFATPWHMIRFAARLPRGRRNPSFVVATRAGVKLGPLFVPGIAAGNLFLLALVLWLKGYRVRGILGVDMPSNWYSLHPIQGPASQHAIIARAERAVARFATAIGAGERWWLTPGNIVEAVFAAALLPVSLLYLFWGRFFLAKLFFANARCNGCGICATSCPVRAIEMWGKREPRPYWRFTCESCMRCGTVCPVGAVEAGHSWGVVAYFATTLPASIYAAIMLRPSAPARWPMGSDTIRRVVVLAGMAAVLYLSYLAFHLLGRFAPVNWLFAKTTLTHYWGRYREPSTPRRELTTPGPSRTPPG
jgi:ferredoxin